MWIKNHKIKKLIEESFAHRMSKEQKNEIEQAVNRLKLQSNDECYLNSFILHLAKVPNTIKSLDASGIVYRMRESVNKTAIKNDHEKECVNDFNKLPVGECDEQDIEGMFVGKLDIYNVCYLWQSKLFTINCIASGKNGKLKAANVFILNLYANNCVFARKVNELMMRNQYNHKCVKLLHDSLSLLPNHVGKIF